MAEPWWNQDTVIAKKISELLYEFADKTSGYPEGFDSLKDWTNELKSLGDKLEKYSRHHDYEFQESMKIVSEGQAALKQLAEYLPGLWD